MTQLQEKNFDELIKAIRSAFSNKPITVFIDPTLGDPFELDAELRATYLEAQQRNLVRRFKLPFIHSNFDQSRCPYLLHVESEEKAERLIAATICVALRELLGLAEERPAARSICAWIGNDMDIDLMASQLSALAKITKPDGAPWYLRYWDPRVIWQLQRVLPEPHWLLMQRTLNGWRYIAPDMKMSAIQLPAQFDSLKPASALESSPIKINEATWGKLQRIGTINNALSMVSEWGFESNDVTARQVDKLLLACERFGFSSQRESLVFVACGLSSNLHFFEHRAISSAFEKAIQSGATLNDALQHFDDEFWEQLKIWRPGYQDVSSRRE